MKVLFLGCGNMASAIALGARAKLGEQLQLSCYTPSQTKARELASKVGGTHIAQLDHTLNWSDFDFVLIGCKPQQVSDLAQQLQDILPQNTALVSILAGTPLQKLQQIFNTQNVTRIMPSTPTLVGQGISLVMHSQGQAPKVRELIERLFSSCSFVHLMDTEEEFDLATTVAACGPAYLFNFAGALTQALSDRGLDITISSQIVRELFVGSSALMQSRSDLSWQQLQDQVTSKGGITWEAIKVFDNYSLSKISSQAISAALNRTEELKKLN